MGLHGGGQNGAAGLRRARWGGEAAGAAFFFGDVADLMLHGQVAFKELYQIVGEAEEVRLRLLGDGIVGPSALGTEFVFEFVVNFFPIPAVQVAEGDYDGGLRKFAGVEFMPFLGGGVRVTDPLQGDPLADREEFVSGDAGVIAVGAVDQIFAGDSQVHLFLGQGDEVDAAALFPFNRHSGRRLRAGKK